MATAFLIKLSVSVPVLEPVVDPELELELDPETERQLDSLRYEDEDESEDLEREDVLERL